MGFVRSSDLWIFHPRVRVDNCAKFEEIYPKETPEKKYTHCRGIDKNMMPLAMAAKNTQGAGFEQREKEAE